MKVADDLLLRNEVWLFQQSWSLLSAQEGLPQDLHTLQSWTMNLVQSFLTGKANRRRSIVYFYVYEMQVLEIGTIPET